MIHHLKTWPRFFGPMAQGVKSFDVRKDDRDFLPGDVLVLEEWQPDANMKGGGSYTGNTAHFIVTYLLKGDGPDDWGLKPGYVVLGLEPTPRPTRQVDI